MRIGIRPGSREGRGGGGMRTASSTSWYRPWNVTRSPRSERQDDLEDLLEPADAVVERVAEGRVLGLVPARPEAEDQAAVRDLVDRRRHLRGQRGRPEARPQDDRAQLGALGRTGDGGEQVQRLVDPVLVLVREAEDEVVVEPEAVDPARLGEPREAASAAATHRRRGRRCRSSGARVRSSSGHGKGRKASGTVAVRSGDLDACRIISPIGELPQRPIGSSSGRPQAALIVTSSPATEVARAFPQARAPVRPGHAARRPPGCGNGRPANGDAKAAHHAKVLAYWTPERMKNAKPRRLHVRRRARLPAGRRASPVAAAPAAARRASRARRGRPGATSSREPAGCVHPRRVELHLLRLRGQGGDADDHVDRADGGPLRHREHGRQFATNWLFIPAFDTAPTYTCADDDYGCWVADALYSGTRRSPRPAGSTTPRSSTTGASRS